jgi:hypothetical protein
MEARGPSEAPFAMARLTEFSMSAGESYQKSEIVIALPKLEPAFM